MSVHPSFDDLIERGDRVRAHLDGCAACRARLRVVDDLDATDGLPGLAEARARMDHARRQGAELLSRSYSSRPSGAAATDLEPGRRVDRYVVEGRLGHGGMGTVYRVRHAELGSHHALKVLHQGFGSLADRLLREGRAQGRLRHPNVVPVTDVVDVDGARALVMELVDGPSLQDWLVEHGPPDIDELDRLAAGIVRGVAAAHRAGLVHRDLKPGNVLLAPSDDGFVPKVSDFGLARLVEEPSSPAISRPRSPLGTPSYMAPEQIRDASTADARSDVFSLGAVLYELATGRRAFGGLDVLDVYDRIRAGSYEPPEAVRPSLPPRIVATLRRALEVDPDRRFGSADALLEAWRGEAPTVSRSWPWRPALAVAAVAVVAAAPLLWLASGDEVTAPGRPVAESRLTALPDTYQIYTFAVSPDGASLAWGDSRGLWIQPMQGAGATRIYDGGTVQNVDWFPDGERLMISSEDVGTLVVDRDGGPARPLLDASGRFVRLSPDGSRVAGTDASGLWVADLADGTRRRLRPLATADETAALAWSPSSDAIAAVHQAPSGSWLEVTAADGSTTRRVLEDRRLVALGLSPLAWGADGLVYGLSERAHEPERTTTLYLLPGLDGAAARPLHALAGVSVTQARLGPDGRVVVAKIVGRRVVYRIPLDAPEGRVRLGADDWEDVPLGFWSDRELLVASDRGGGGIFRVGLDGGEPEQLAAGAVVDNHADRVGDALVWWTTDDYEHKRTLIVRRTEGGVDRDLVELPVERHQLRCVAAGSCLMGERRGDRYVFRPFDPDTGDLGQVLLKVGVSPGGWDLSPDGRRLAIGTGKPGVLALHDLARGVEERLRLDLDLPLSIAWGPDGQRVFVGGLTESAVEPYQVVEVDLEGGDQRTLWSNRSWYLYGLTPSPDGRDLVVGAYTFDDDLWAIDGLFR